MEINSDANDPVKVYLREATNVQPLAPDEEADLLVRIRGPRDDKWELAARRLIEVNLHLVVSIAENHSSAGMPMLHLLEEGNLGLLRALDSFPTNSAITFSDYAATCIERAISQAIAASRSDTADPQTDG